MEQRTCSISGCTDAVKARGWCNAHWLRWSRHGDPLYEQAKTAVVMCCGTGCDRLAEKLTFCGKHYYRWRKYGDPDAGFPRGPRPKPKPACSVAGCGEDAYCRTWCRLHYDRWCRHGDPLYIPAERLELPCAVSGCAGTAAVRGWCLMHYKRWKAHGDPLVTLHTEKCQIEGCDAPHIARGWCTRHYTIWARHGDPLVPVQSKCPPYAGQLCKREGCEHPAAKLGWCPGCYRTQEHPEYGRKAGHIRRVRLLELPYEDFHDLEIFERDNWACGICSRPVDRALRWPDRMSASLDHVIPVARGGHHIRGNVQLAHLICNMRKSASLLPLPAREVVL